MDSAEYVVIAAVCRICLAQRGTVDIFENENKEKTLLGYSVSERIMSFACVEVKTDDGLPSKICFKCLTGIDQAFKFKAQCEYADAALRELCSEDNVDGSVCFLTGEDGEKDGLNLLEVPNAPDSVAHVEKIASELEHPNEPDLPNSYPSEPDLPDMNPTFDGTEDHEEGTSKEVQEEICVSADTGNNTGCYESEINSTTHENHKQVTTTGNLAVCNDLGNQCAREKKLDAVSCLGHRPSSCKICGKRFVRLCNLREHEKRHHGPNKFLCSNCGQLASGKKNHYCTVVNDRSDKSYSCDICKKKFVSRSTLFTHKKRHGSQSKYQCFECKKLYFSRQELERHARTHSNSRPFECSEEGCKLTFFSQGELNRHERYHKGIKRFVCSLCGQKFFESGHLATHERKHTGERPYSCRHCPKTFTDSSKLRRHSLGHMRLSSRQRVTLDPFEEDLCGTSNEWRDEECLNDDSQNVAVEDSIKVVEVKLESYNL